MNQEIKKRWVAALRSGSYKQRNGRLRYTEGDLETKYCCLGVLCDIVKDELGLEWVEQGTILGRTACIPNTICEYTGVHAWGEFARTDNQCVERDNYKFSNLAHMNDNGFSFEEIAQVIEEKL